MCNSPSPKQMRITDQVERLLKCPDLALVELWRMWERESSTCADEFVVAIITELVATRGLLSLQARKEAAE